jgi:2-polyprenyl-3-methyl-5-hydroxy-6-metoxy-1,4-benzoquinol methylase
MKSSFLETIVQMLQIRNPEHALKISRNLIGLSDSQMLKADLFLRKYSSYLERQNKTLDYAVECYLRMIDEIIEERIGFIRNGKYSCNSFEDVERRIYKNPEIMVSYMHALVLAQFLWYEQIQRFSFFSENIVRYFVEAGKYLEIGGGHGLYIEEALSLSPLSVQFDLVDISQSSLDLAKGILANDKINYIHQNILDLSVDGKMYDFITIGEVLEHLEEPLELLKKVRNFISTKGVLFVSVPINAPMIDHIYLFNNEAEIHELFALAGLKILKEKTVISDNEEERHAQKFKTPRMYAAFLQFKN